MPTDQVKTKIDAAKTVEEPQKKDGKKGPVSKAKLRSIMEAASALTSLGDEDEDEDSTTNDQTDDKHDGADDEEIRLDADGKRYIPSHKKPDSALTFPEKLMSMMKTANKEDPKTYCVAWLPDGKSFVIRNPDEFTRKVLPHYFKATKFSSFTRKLYRWGFRQVNRGIGPDDPIIFGNEYFQRDGAESMVKMRSITAAGTRKAQSMEAAQAEIEAHRHKRPLDMGSMDDQRKRQLLEQFYHQQQKMGMGGGQPEQQNFMGQSSFPQFNLASALRPNIGIQGNANGLKSPMNAMSNSGQGFNQNPLSMYMPQGAGNNNQGQQQQGQQQPQQQAMNGLQQNAPYNPASTAEIVNAAINALRYAS